MRQIVIDELSQADCETLESHFKKTLEEGGMSGIYWLPLPEDLFSEVQREHQECGPFVFGIELSEKRLQAELLVRSSHKLHCSCIGYAGRKQRDFLFDFLDELLEGKGITS